MAKRMVGKVVKQASTREVIIDGNHIGDLRDILGESISPSGVQNIVNTSVKVVEQLVEIGSGVPERRGLLFGKIQSGKTNMLTGSIAMAADNHYRCFIVLTSDNLWLYDQTLSRLKKALPGLQIVGKDDWDQKVGAIKSRLTLDGVVFVCTKNGTNLESLVEIVKQTGAQKFPAVIIDDEADQASLDTNNSKEDEDVSKINGLITELREKFESRTYLQVTATPQALFLLGRDKPYRPEFTILTDPGDSYIGGETFFGNTNNQHLLVEVDEDELETLKTGKVASVNKTIPEGLRKALCSFYVGATIKNLKGEGRHFSFLCHVSLKKADHDHIRNIIQNYNESMVTLLRGGDDSPKRKQLVRQLEQAYNDLAPHVTSVPLFNDVLAKLQRYISSTDIQVINTSGKNATSQPRYDSVYNILIGGTKLGRGVTIERLLVTYYGRQAKKPQMDTVLQHARMYGYRSKDLEVSRIFLPEHLIERFKLIYESETDLRDVITEHKDEGLRGIWLDKGINPTRKNVLDPNELGFFAAGKTYFPHKPMYLKKDIAENTEKINNLLKDFKKEPGTQGVKVPIDFIIDVLKLTKTEKNSPGLWNDKRIILSAERIAERYKEAYLIVRENRELKKKDSARGLGAVYQSSELQLANSDLPTLLMLRQNGRSKHGWDDQEFWIPAFRFPEGSYALIFNLA